ncbi:MAG: hypothetical protein AAF125_02710 [Chloroflexota bacterium]
MRWLVPVLVMLLTVTVSAQDGGFLRDAANTQISLVNPFTGAGITVTVLRVIYIVGGLILLFAGWSAYRLALGVAGFVVGSSIGAGLVTGAGTALSLTVTIACGIIGGLIATFVYLLAVALVGGYVGLLVTAQAVALLDLQTGQGPRILIFGAGMVIGAVAALALAVELTIILTSAFGAVMVAGGTGLLNGQFGGLWALLLFVVGVVAQMQVARSRGSNPFERRD